MNSYSVKFGISVAVGLVGFGLIMARINIDQIIIGFLIVSVAVVFGSYFWAKLKQPKNPMSEEIEELLRRAQNKDLK